jgi:hypothetical protein
MRTTINVDDEVLARAKRLARERNTSLSALVEEALREMVACEPGDQAGQGSKRVELPSGELHFEFPPHVNTDKTHEMLAYLDSLRANP